MEYVTFRIRTRRRHHHPRSRHGACARTIFAWLLRSKTSFCCGKLLVREKIDFVYINTRLATTRRRLHHPCVLFCFSSCIYCCYCSARAASSFSSRRHLCDSVSPKPPPSSSSSSRDVPSALRRTSVSVSPPPLSMHVRNTHTFPYMCVCVRFRHDACARICVHLSEAAGECVNRVFEEFDDTCIPRVWRSPRDSPSSLLRTLLLQQTMYNGSTCTQENSDHTWSQYA